jgi:anti-sigma B factor antagonist
MKILFDKQEKFTVLKPEEQRVDSLIAPQLKSQIVLTASEGVKNLIIDLTTVEYMDSSGLSALLVADRLCKSNNGVFVLTGLQDPIKKIVEISHLNDVIVIVGTLIEAKDYVIMSDIENSLLDE